MSELKKDSVERTLCIPLWSRAIAVRKLPQILSDHDAVRILEEMGEKQPPTVFYHLQCAALAGAIRQYDFACEIKDYLNSHPKACVVELGAGLSCLRRQIGNDINPWVSIDFPDVIACREKYIPKGEKEINLIGDITDHSWMDAIPFKKEDGIIFLAARGKMVVEEGDDLIMNIPPYYPAKQEQVLEVYIYSGHKWANKTIEEINFPQNQSVILLVRNEEKIIPDGDTMVLEKDVLLIFSSEGAKALITE